jgi:uncharacterized protein (TIGR00730 family)
MELKRITVFCGSNPGKNPEYMQAAANLGQRLAGRGLGLVYGGGKVGMMGHLAKSARDAGGQVIGVIPVDMVNRKLAYTALSDLRVVENMHERKALMAELGDGFIAMPGGFGTLEEMFEVLTWGQLGLHGKPCGLLNIAGFYNPLLAFLDQVCADEFIAPEHRAMLLVSEDVDTLLDGFARYSAPKVDKAVQALKKSAVE